MSKTFRTPKEGCWPTPEQTLLLRACLFKGATALEAWRLWRERVIFDALDGASYRLVPLLYHNLREDLTDDPMLSRLKGIYRHNWTRNQLLFHAAAEVLRAVNDAGIPTMLLKGAPLAELHYRDAGLRPMGDFDFMVTPENALRAFEILQRNGWASAETVPLEQLIWCSHAAKFRNSRAYELDIHWHLLPEWRMPGVDEEIWRGAMKMEFAGLNLLCTNTTDLLLHVCVHGAVGDSIPPIRWIPDAWTILATAPNNVDWKRLVTITRKRGLTLSVGCSLEYLREEFGAPVPLEVIAEMRNTPHSWLERWEYRIKSRPRGLTGALPLHCVNYLRLMAGKSLWQKIIGLPVFFQRVWGLRNWRQIPVYAMRKFWPRFKLRILKPSS